MTKKLTIALDAMGGDDAPYIVVKGAEKAQMQNNNLHLIFVGNEDKLKPLLKSAKKLTSYDVIHAEDVVAPDEKPSQALRGGKNTSMWQAIQQVADGKADAVVSAGNTGALMAMSKLQLRMLPGVSRPAIATFLPTMRSATCMLDLGANIEVDAENLIQFAVMGEAFCRDVTGITAPSIGLLNVGEEDQKGYDYLREAAEELNEPDLKLNYAGFVEGSDIMIGKTDVIVTDGFTGNVALKTAEGTSALITHSLREAFSATLYNKVSYLLARPVLKLVRRRMDPRRYNGAVFLGLNGIAVKSHGGTDKVGYANAIKVAIDLVEQGFLPEISESIARVSDIRAKRAAKESVE